MHQRAAQGYRVVHQRKWGGGAAEQLLEEVTSAQQRYHRTTHEGIRATVHLVCRVMPCQTRFRAFAASDRVSISLGLEKHCGIYLREGEET